MRFPAIHQTTLIVACLVAACAQNSKPGIEPTKGGGYSVSATFDYSSLDADGAAKLLGDAEAEFNRWASMESRPAGGHGGVPPALPAPPPPPPPAPSTPQPGSTDPQPLSTDPVSPQPGTNTDGVTKNPAARPPPDSYEYESTLSRCARMCRALGSMRRATERLCELTGESDERCEDARTRVERASARVVEVCPTCRES